MNKLRGVVNNTIISLAGQGVTWISTLMLTIAYGHFLGEVKFGELYFATSYILLIASPLEFSFNQQIIRDVSQEPEKALSYFSNTLVLKLLLWLVLYILALTAVHFLGYTPEEQLLVAICGLTLLSTAISSIVRSLHYSFEHVLHPVIATIIEKGISALIGFVLLRYGAGVQVMVLVLLGGSIAGAAWQTIWLFRLIGFSFTIDFALMRKLVRAGVPFLVYGMLLVIYGRIDTFLLSLLTSAEVVGWYGASYRLFDTLLFLPALIVNPIMYPIFSKYSNSSEEGLKQAIEKCTNFLLFFAIPMTTGLIVIAPNIISFLYQRPEYVHSILALQMLAPGIIFLYLNTVLTSIIICIKQEKKIMIMALIALIFNLGLNLLLIPRYQHVATALVTTLTEMLLFGLAMIFIPRRLLPWRSLLLGLKATIASIVMAAALLALRALNANLLELLPVAIIAYFGTALLIRTIPQEDLRSLLNVFQRKFQAEPILEEDKLTEKLAVASTPNTPVPSGYRRPLPAFLQIEPNWIMGLTTVDELFENVMETTMSRPAFRMQQPFQQLPTTPHELTIPTSETDINTGISVSIDTQKSNKEHVLKGYQYQLTGIYHMAMKEYSMVGSDDIELLNEVISNLRALLKLEPEFLQGYRILGDIYIKQGEHNLALEAYNKALAVIGEDYVQMLRAYRKALTLSETNKVKAILMIEQQQEIIPLRRINLLKDA